MTDSADIFSQRLMATDKILEAYADDPIENIHDVMISIWRLNAAYCILPKAQKTKKLKKIVPMYEILLAVNGTIQDQDSILDRLEQYGYGVESLPSLQVQRKKFRRLLRALDVADNIPSTKKLKAGKFMLADNKFQNQAHALIKKLMTHTETVTGGKADARNIRAMQKTTKKLWHVLEINSDTQYTRLLTKLSLLQDLLDFICDCDVFIRYLQRNQEMLSCVDDMLKAERKKRNMIYESLVQALTKSG